MIIGDFAAYLNPHGLIDIDPGVTSQNCLHFTGLACIVLSRHQRLGHFWEGLLNATLMCEDPHHPGVFRRDPSNMGDQISLDDMIGLACIASYLDHTIAERVLKHWRKTGGKFYNSKDWEGSGQGYLDRFPQVLVSFQYAAEERPSLLNSLYWSGSIILSTFQSYQDGHRMSAMMVDIARDRTLISSLTLLWWNLKFGDDGVVASMKKYWPNNWGHPLIKYWKVK